MPSTKNTVTVATKASARKAAKAKNAALKAEAAKHAALAKIAAPVEPTAPAVSPSDATPATVPVVPDTATPRELLLDSSYGGASLPVHTGRKARSYTELAKRVMRNYTARTDSFMRDGLAKYGIKPFADTGGDKSVREQLAFFGMLTKRDASTIEFTPFAAEYAAKNTKLPLLGQTTADGVFSAAKRFADAQAENAAS